MPNDLTDRDGFLDAHVRSQEALRAERRREIVFDVDDMVGKMRSSQRGGLPEFSRLLQISLSLNRNEEGIDPEQALIEARKIFYGFENQEE